MGQQHIDMIAGIDGSRDCAGGGGRHADGPQAGLEHGGQEAARPRHDDIGFDHGLTDMERVARDGADEFGDRPLAFDNVGRRQRTLWPSLPSQVVGLDV
jgi:hypothetical protein